MDDFASSDIRGFLMTETPSARQAKATALIVWDFDEGILIAPDNEEARDLSFTSGCINNLLTA